MSAYLSAVVADAPYHYWRCADPGGSVLVDIGSQRLFLGMAATSIQLPYSGPVSDGGSMLCLSNTFAWDVDGELIGPPATIEAWVWRLSVNGANADFAGITSSGGITLAQLRWDGGGLFRFFSTGGACVSPLAYARQPAQWHHVVGTIDAVAARLYVDGSQVATASGSAAGPGVYRSGVGAQPNGASGSAYLVGFVSEVAFYTSALSPTRVNAHYAAADQYTQRPSSKMFGSTSSSTGVTTTLSDDTAAILASVHRTYPPS